jgi:hypothetical protein
MSHCISFGLERFFVVFAFQKAFQSIQPLLPKALVVLEPPCRLAQSFSLQRTVMRASLDFATDQPGLLQDFQVFGDTIEREIELVSHLQNTEAFVCQVREHFPAYRVGKRMKSFVQWTASIFNHQVEYTRC